MRLFLLLLWIMPINGFAKLPLIKTLTKIKDKFHNREPRMIQNMEYFQHFKQGSLIEYPENINGYIELTRIKKNFIPTTILIFLSGLVTSPTYLRTWIFSKPFISSFFMVHLLTSASMVINDIYDLEIDKINNPTRPLPSGFIKINQANNFFIGLITLYTIIGLKYLPFLKSIWIGSLLGIILYTPFFKKITLIKNLVCSSIITLSIPFVGFSVLSVIPSGSLPTSLGWMYLTMRILFIHSFFIELLLDILDKDGDSKYNIKTLPVVFGRTNSLYFLSLSLLGNFYSTLIFIMQLYGSSSNYRDIYKSIMMIVAVAITYQPLILNSTEILQNKFSKNSIKNAVGSTFSSMLCYFFVYLTSLLI